MHLEFIESPHIESFYVAKSIRNGLLYIFEYFLSMIIISYERPPIGLSVWSITFFVSSLNWSHTSHRNVKAVVRFSMTAVPYLYLYKNLLSRTFSEYELFMLFRVSINQMLLSYLRRLKCTEKSVGIL